MTRACAAGLAALLVGVLASVGPGGDVGFVEDYALAADRPAALRQLVPGTDDYYYYHALHALTAEQFERVAELTAAWHQRHGQTARLTEVQTRAALLSYGRAPEKTLDYLRTRLGLRYDHRRDVPGAAPDLPTALDPKAVDRATLAAAAAARQPNGLDPFEDAALDWLAATDLTWERRRALLRRLPRPDVPNLPQLVAADLAAPRAEGFGAYPVHARMTVPQLAELVTLRPELRNDTTLVRAWVTKLQPWADSDWRHDRAEARAYSDRLLAFVLPLAPVHNPLKAHALYHRLVLDRADGASDKARFLQYLALPRRQPYMARALLEADDSRRFPADLAADYAAVTLLPPVGADEDVVRSYLKHFLADAPSPAEFAPFVDDTYLRHLFAETKVELGLGDQEAWASQLPPDRFARLKERVDLDFAYTNKTDFAAAEPVALDLFVKNVPTLLVKVFEVNTVGYYRTHQREVDTDVNLDGLVPNAERAVQLSESPLRRVARPVPLPELAKPGVYVVDVIGAGKSSRALVRKGRLRPVVGTGTAGQTVTVVDDARRPVPGAVVWLGGREYKADDKGVAVVPYTAQPGRRPVVLSAGEFASLDAIDHQPEAYHFAAGIYVDREQLLTRRVAQVIVRPGLFLNGQPVSTRLLEAVRLTLTATDQAGVASVTEVPDFTLFEDREAVSDFRVPARLASLAVSVSATVKSLSTGAAVAVAAGETFAVNGIDRTDKLEDLHLARFGPDYAVEVRGRTGEPRADRAVRLAFKHRDFTEPVRATLKTDARGRVTLGPVADVVTVTATGPEGTTHHWPLATGHAAYRRVVHAQAGETVAVPYLGVNDEPSRAEIALFAVRGDVILADRFAAHVAVVDGSTVELRGLPRGDYDLVLKRAGETVRVRVTDGPVVAGHVLGVNRFLELPRLDPVRIAAAAPVGDTFVVRLAGASPFTRVHLFATRYAPQFSAYGHLAAVRAADLGGTALDRPGSVYLTGRNIGDEYRYVLDRRGLKHFPGNMLDRPGLLLNPWAVRTTDAGEQLARDGDRFGRLGAPPPGAALPPGAVDRPMRAGGGNGPDPDVTPDLDFLADPAAVLLNLVPNRDGVVRVDRAALGPHSVVRVVAVDPLGTTARTVTLPEQPAGVLDLRLRAGLDPAGHFTQQKRATVLPPGQPFVLADAAAGRFEAYDSVAKVYALYATLSRDPKFAEFAFVPAWPTLPPERKRALYSQFACHELNVFLSKKDPAFFAAVVKPYLANKKDQTFLDHALLGDDVRGFLDPWRYGGLNAAERLLLGRAVPGELANTARGLDDLLRLTPPDPAREAFEFETAVASTALGVTDALGLKRTLDELQQRGMVALSANVNSDPGAEGVLGEFKGERAGAMAGKPAAGPGGPMGGAAGRLFRNQGTSPAGRPGDPRQEADKAARDGRGDRGKDGAAADAKEKAELFFDNDRKKLAEQVRQLYRRVEPTQEWAENNYYHLRADQQGPGLVPVGGFWLDYARHDGAAPFLSRRLAAAGRTFTEAMFALAVLDLPFEPAKHDAKFADRTMTFTPAGPLVAFHEEVRPAAAPDGSVPVLVGQHVYRPGDRYRDENGEKVDKFVSGEFLTHTVYGGQVVVTNPTSTRQRLTVLVQLPTGSVPLAGGQFTRSVPLDLEPYRTVTVDTLFYFPKPGAFVQFPAHVAKAERVVAAAKPVTFTVVDTPTRPDTTSWMAVSQTGTDDEVLAYLARENVQALDLDKIAFRMRDRAVFDRVTALLRERHAYSSTLWSYALLHGAGPAAREFLAHSDQVVAECGGPIDSPLLTVDPVERHGYEHLEYKPLVNARAHALGHRRQIVNDALNQQYHRLLKQLTYRRALGDADQLAVTYYLLLQDRVAEAQAAFARVSPDKVPTRLQYDYCAAYLAMFADDPEPARAIARKYADYPVDRWRTAFAAVRTQLDEAAGKGPPAARAADPGVRQDHLAATEPGFEVKLDGAGVAVTWQNLDAVTVHYHLMDVELLFSRAPFAQAAGGQFAVTRPNAAAVVTLPAGGKTLRIPLPAEFATRNVLVEVTAAGRTRTVPYFAAALDVTLTEAFGQVTVADAATGRPAATVYVKAYARLADGTVKFHKDGYTDHRGRFDYATVSTPERSPVERFAVLVLSDARGAVIREAAPPQQ